MESLSHQTINQEELDKYLKAKASQNDVAAVEKLLHLGANPNSKDKIFSEPVLMTAIENNGIEATKLLLQAGADANIGWASWSPLMKAAINGYTAIAKILLDHGADVHYLDSEENSILDAANRSGNPDTIALLKSHMDNESLEKSIALSTANSEDLRF